MPKKPKQQDLEIIAPLFDSAMFAVAPPTPEPEVAPKPDPNAPMSAEEAEQHDRSHAMLTLLLDLDMGRDWIAALMTLDNRLTLEQYRYLAGPILIGKAGDWEKGAFEPGHWIYKAVAKDRLDIVMDEIKTGVSSKLASNSEFITAMYAATMVAPMQRDYSDIYIHVSRETFKKHKVKGGESFLDEKDYPIIFSRVEGEYRSLARDIRSRVVAAAQRAGVNFDFKKKYSPTKGKGFAPDDAETTPLASTRVQQSLQF